MLRTKHVRIAFKHGILGVIACIAIFTGYEQIATGCVVGIAATLDKIVQKTE